MHRVPYEQILPATIATAFAPLEERSRELEAAEGEPELAAGKFDQELE